MAKGKPYSDSEIRPETPEVLRNLESMRYKSPEWNRDAGIKDRGLGLVDVDDGMEEDVYAIDKLSEKRRGLLWR